MSGGADDPRPGSVLKLWKFRARRLLRWKSDIAVASKEATGSSEVQRAMGRAALGLGAALAFVTALSVHEALRALH